MQYLIFRYQRSVLSPEHMYLIWNHSCIVFTKSVLKTISVIWYKNWITLFLVEKSYFAILSRWSIGVLQRPGLSQGTFGAQHFKILKRWGTMYAMYGHFIIFDIFPYVSIFIYECHAFCMNQRGKSP